MNYDGPPSECDRATTGIPKAVASKQLETDIIIGRLNTLLDKLSENNNRLDSKVGLIMGHNDNDICEEDCVKPIVSNFLSKVHEIISMCDEKVVSTSRNLDRLDQII